ncbi:hypothetical protein GW17_00029985 [Ensete ventricosum]|nr:hypothetical protein GW17_00029985 [Ensete ventricosum]
MLEWVEAAENQEDPLLNEPKDPQRPSRFITEAIEEEEAHPQQVKDPPQSEHGERSQSTSDTQLLQSSAQCAKAKEKGKAIASATSLERIKSGDEAPSQSIQGHDTNTNNSSPTDNGGDVGESEFPSPFSPLLPERRRKPVSEGLLTGTGEEQAISTEGRRKKKREKKTWSPLCPPSSAGKESPSRSIAHRQFLRRRAISSRAGRRNVSPPGEKERGDVLLEALEPRYARPIDIARTGRYVSIR